MLPTITANVGFTKVPPAPSSALTKLKQESEFETEFAAEIDTYKVYFVKKFPGNCADVGIKYKFLGAALDKVNRLNFGIPDFFHHENKSHYKRSSFRMILRNTASVVRKRYGQRVFAKRFSFRVAGRNLARNLLGALLIITKMSKRVVRAALLFFNRPGGIYDLVG